MIEVCAGLLLGSEGDARAVVDRQRSIIKRYTVTHILSITNEPPDWLDSNQSEEGDNKENVGGAVETGGGAKEEIVDGSKKEDVGGVKEEVVGGAKEEIKDGAEEEEVGGAKEGIVSDTMKERVGGAKVKKEQRNCNKLKTLFVQGADVPKTDLLHHFEKCCQFIQQGIEQGTILVHCVYGISRSATVVLAYLMWKQGRGLDMTLKELLIKKPNVRPNSGFMEQLQLWGSMKCRIDTNNKKYKVYRLRYLADTLDFQDMTCMEEVRNAMSADPNVESQDSAAYYRCRKCRRLLFTEESLLQHDVGEGQAAFKWHKRSDIATPLATSKMKSEKIMCSSYFIEPVEWMDEMMQGNVEGKVMCPKCASRLGSFNWVGHQCSCGQWVTPSFQIHKGKVDETRTLHRRKVTGN